MLTATDPDGDEVSPQVAWTRDGLDVAVQGTSVPGSGLRRGEVWTVTARPTDGSYFGELVSTSVTVGNVVPSITSIDFVPAAPTAASGARADVTASDPDGDTLSGEFTWTLDGQVLAGTSGNQVPGTLLVRGKTLRVMVSPRDGVGVGESKSAEVVVANAPPSRPLVSINATPAHDEDITCTVSNTALDPDGDPVALSFTWTRNGVAYTGASNGPTSSTVAASDTTQKDVFSCGVIATEVGTAELLASALAQASARVGCEDPLRTGMACDRCIDGRSGSQCEVREWAEWPMPTQPAAGLAHPASLVVSGDTVLDQVTGLEWQREAGNVGFALNDAKSHCEGLSLGGKDDWRLPSRIELLSVLDHTRPQPCLYPEFVNGIESSSWTSTQDTSNPDAYYTLIHGNSGTYQSIFLGEGFFAAGINPRGVRCVRGGPAVPPPGPHYSVANGVVKDNYTRLEWQQQNSTLNMTSGSAATYCQGLTLAGGGWRLPDLHELATLVRERVRSPALDVSAFPYGLTYGNWSSTAVQWATGYTWAVNFSDGSIDKAGALQIGVRCVR